MDCDDPDCQGDARGETCNNGINDDGDCYTDCEDPECVSWANPETFVEECSFGLTNDVVRCNYENQYYEITQYCGLDYVTPVYGAIIRTEPIVDGTSPRCSDGQDNDLDVWVDDDDMDCGGIPPFPPCPTDLPACETEGATYQCSSGDSRLTAECTYVLGKGLRWIAR
jgi:hypothetical protein